MQHPPKASSNLDLCMGLLAHTQRQIQHCAALADAMQITDLHDDCSHVWVALLRMESRLGAKGKKYRTLYPSEEVQLQLLL